MLELLFKKISKTKGVNALGLENFILALEELFASDELKEKINEICAIWITNFSRILILEIFNLL